MEWQPIETAPKDGTPILAIVRGNHYSTGEPLVAAVVEIMGDGRIHLHCDSDVNNMTSFKYWPLSHWMPLPSPPKAVE